VNNPKNTSVEPDAPTSNAIAATTARPSHWPLAITAIGLGTIIFILVTVFLVARGCENIVDKLAQAFKPDVGSKTVIDGGIGKLKFEPKLVVVTIPINCTLEKTMTTKILWGIPIGSTRVTVRALENHVQYIIPADQIAADGKSRYDEKTKTLHFCVPFPRLDLEMISVQSDPAKIEVLTEGAWLSLDRYEGKFVRDMAMADLRPKVIQIGQHELVKDSIRQNCPKIVARMLTRFFGDKLRPGVKVQVDFDE
jgi:hypothetical protein